jgi:Na+/melibiose symporter-like transporter
LLKVFRQRNFFLLWIGQFISVVGDWVLIIALPFYTYSLTGSALASGGMFIVSTLPRLALGSLAGVFVDRWDRKRTMIVADILRVLLTLLLFFVRSRDWLWLIYTSAFLESVVSQFFNPAKSAVIPLLVDEKDLLTANSLNGLSDALTRLVGSALGGMLLGWLGFSFVVLFDAGSFLFSAIMILPILMPARPPAPTVALNDPATASVAGMWRDWLAGLRLVKRERLLLALFIILGVASLGDSMVTVLIVPLVKVLMGGGPQLLGWLMMAEGLGGLLGGLLVAQFGRHISPRYLSTLALVSAGLVIFTLITLPHSVLVFPLMALVGLLATAWFTSAETLLQLGTADAFRGRIFGALGTTLALASLAGMFFAGAMSDRIGLVLVLTVSSSLYVLSGLLAWFMLARSPQLFLKQPIPTENV